MVNNQRQAYSRNGFAADKSMSMFLRKELTGSRHDAACGIIPRRLFKGARHNDK